MKILRKVALCLLFFCALHWADAQVVDNFDDGDFTNNPTWAGDGASWTVEAGRLKSNNTTANATFHLSTPNTLALAARWEFSFELDFATSGSNYLDFWIISPDANLATTSSGYFVRIGGTPDEICLFKRTAGTDTKIIDGADQMVPSGSAGKIVVVRSSGGAFKLIQKGVSAADTLVGTATDAEYATTAHIGVYVRQSTASFFQRHFVDNVQVSAFGGPDTDPPVLTGVTVTSAHELDLLFSEPVDAIFSSNASLYSIMPAATINSASRLGSNINTVRLVLADPLSAGSYTVSVAEARDTTGNTTAAPMSKVFTYAPVVPPRYRLVVINEVMVAPSVNAGTEAPQVEWIELFNPGTVPVSMENWTIRDGSATAPKVIPTTIIPPQGYIVLASATNAPLFQGIATVAPVTLPSLNNDKDSLVLSNADGFAIDIVPYRDTWYHDSTNVKKAGGFSLEQVNPFLKCSGDANWKGANFPQGGSPGAQNTVYAVVEDVTPPTFVGFEVVTLSRIQLQFSEFLKDTALLASNFIFNGVAVAEVQNRTPTADRITIILPQPITEGLKYTLTFSGVFDCAGNLAAPISATIAKGKRPNKYELLITEIQSDDSPENNLPQAEYLELFNTTGFVLDVKGVQITDGSSTAVLPAGIISPGEYVVLCASSGKPKFSAGQVFGLTSWPSLNSEGDNLTLLSASGVWLHQMHYQSSRFSPYSQLSKGWSLEMIDPTNPCDQLENWAVSVAAPGGTPGGVNSVKASKPDLKPVSLVQATIVDSVTIRLKWDELVDSLTLANIEVTIVPDTFLLQSRLVSSADYAGLTIKLNRKIERNQAIAITVGPVKDCAGNSSATAVYNIGRSVIADSTSWTLNEILFDPKTGGVDYVELKNNSGKYLDLREISIANDDETRSIVSEITVVAPGGFALLTSSKALTLRDYPKGKVENFIETTLPSFNSDSGTVRIVGPGFRTWQKFFYSDKIHSQILDETKGVSLERISASLPVNEVSSWQSASSDAGFGTPGYENSQDRSVGSSNDFKAEPKAFSPNGDGNKDFTIFTYGQSKSGLIGNLRIYSADGLLVRNLAESANLGSQGFWKWDGVTEEGKQARMGMYIAVLETTELGGDTKYYKIPVAIAADR